MTAMRIAGWLFVMPSLLMTAALTDGLVASLTEFAVLAASLAGVSMVLCALSLMRLRTSILTILSFGLYGAGLAAIGIFSVSSATLWLMVAALPLELWLASRKVVTSFIGAVAAVLILAAFAIIHHGVVSGGTLASVAVMIIYAASLFIRINNLSARQEKDAKVEPLPLLCDGDVQFVLDSEGCVVSLDPATSRYLGVSSNMLEGTNLIDRIHVTDRIHYLTILADIRDGNKANSADIRLRAMEEGAPVFRSFRMEAAKRGDTILLFGRSLENEQRLLDEITVLKAGLQSERASKGVMLAAVSHELRTPLNSIIGFSDMLTHGVGGELVHEKQREYAGLIHQSGHYLLELVNAVLDNSQLESGTYAIAPQQFAFREAVEMCTAVMLPQAEKNKVAFCHRVGHDVGELRADRRAVQQILLNLASNAVKFTQAGGCVTLDAARTMVEGRAMLELSISDTGIGMTQEDLKRVGMPFVRADNSYTRGQEGSGLGLSVVKGLVELHQGTMMLKSCVAEGTVVTVRLPIAGSQVTSQHLDKENQQLELGAVIDMHGSQGERRNDWQKDEDRGQFTEQSDAKARKTA